MTGTQRRAARRAFTIIEVIVIVVILGVIAAVIAPRLLSRVGQSKQAVARRNAESLASAMRLYAADMDGVPEPGTSIMVLWQKPSSDDGKWKGPYVDNEDALKDPWGNLYVLVIPGAVNADFDVKSLGKDGLDGSESENADIVNGKR